MSNKAANRFGFDAVRMTGLKYHFNNTVNPILVNHFVQKFETVMVRCHNGTADTEVAIGNSPVNIVRIFFDFPFNSLGTRTVFIGYDNTAVIFNSFNNLFRSPAHRTACNKNARPFIKLFPGRIFSFDFIRKGIQLICQPRTVKLKGTAVKDSEQFKPCNRCRIVLHNSVKALQGTAHSVFRMYGLTNGFVCNNGSEFFF